ncbi:MAG: amidohydrolase [Planctomycetota bacterium]|nr:MAG: amidohydrolase [Planctomycetota bacterium]
MLNRRQALGVIGMSAAALAGGIGEAANPASGWVDAHSHIWTRDLTRYPLANGQGLDDLKPASFTAEELIQLAGAHGVTRVVLIQHKPYHGLDNHYITDSIAQFPGVFSGVACIEADHAHPEKEMDRLQKLGMRGFRIRPGEGGTPLWRDSVGMKAMWAHAARQGTAICPLIGPEDLHEVETLCRLYPETPVVIDHFARIGMMGAISEEQVQSLCKLAQFPKVHVKISAYYALGKKQPPHTELIPMMQSLITAYGCRRLMWGSDCPYQLTTPNTYGDSLKLLTTHSPFLSDADRQELLKGTATRVFFG